MHDVRDRADGVAVTRHRSALGVWERAWRGPSPPLRGLVAGYHGFRQRMTEAAVHRGVPSPVVPLVVSFGPPQRVVARGGDGPAVTVGSFVAGLHDRFVLIDAEEFHGIQVDLRPVAAYRILGAPLRELTDATVPLDALLGAGADRLVDDLATARDWPTRFRRLDRELVGRLAAGGDPSAEVAHAWDRLAATRGRARVADLAAEVGWSQRRLAARFGQELGLAPKRMARLVRFDHASALLSRSSAPGLAGVAADAGYYDQAHLTNEVRAFCGLSPAQLLRRRLPDAGGVFDLERT